MAIVALFFDALALLLFFIYPLVIFFAACTFVAWFMIRGVKLFDLKRLLMGGGGVAVEIFPLTAWLPGITAAVLSIALSTRIKKIVP